jgi:tetratricopeptide (TPR) repeat protein
MGLFDQAKQIVSKEQGLSQEDIEDFNRYISKIENLIKEIEKKVEEGLIDEVLYSLNDVIQVYQGAPIYNIAGVLHFYKGDLINAYRFFYKAVIINPLEENILRNLSDVAKQIGKEEEVISLINRILSTQETKVS